MPQIPIYQRRVSITGEGTGVLQNVGAAGIVGEAMTRLGAVGQQETAEWTNIIARRNEELWRQNNAFAVLKAQNGIDDDVRAFRQTYDIEAKKGDRDPGALMEFTKEQTEKFKTDLNGKYFDGLSDPDQKVKIGEHIRRSIDSVLDHTSVFQANARKEFGVVEAAKALDISVKFARDDGMDPEAAMESYRAKIGALHATGAISKEEATASIMKADQQIAAAYVDGLLVRDPKKAAELIRSGSLNKYIPDETYRRFQGRAEQIEKQTEQEKKDKVEGDAYADISLRFGTDYRGAMAETLKAETAKKYGLTINQQQNIAQSFNALHATAEKQKKDDQEKNIGALYTKAATNPVQAVKDAEAMSRLNPDSVDPKDLLQFKNATETHLRQMSLMSQQERQIRIDLEDKGKAKINQDILTGAYTDEKKLMADIMAGGFTDTDGFMTKAVALFRKERENFGQVNQLQLAKEDWNRLIGLTKDKDKKKEMSDQASQIMQTLTDWAQKNAIKTTDPQVYKKYQEIKETMTSSWFTRFMEKPLPWRTGTAKGGDVFVPAPKPEQATGMTEAQIRQQLADKNVTGAEQDRWVKVYRERGIIR